MIDELIEFLLRMVQGMGAIIALFSFRYRKKLVQRWRQSKLVMFEECIGALVGIVLIAIFVSFLSRTYF
jgi:hypothetical protein